MMSAHALSIDHDAAGTGRQHHVLDCFVKRIMSEGQGAVNATYIHLYIVPTC